MAAILGECNSESNRTPCNVSVVSILLVQQRGNFRIVRQFFCNRLGEDRKFCVSCRYIEVTKMHECFALPDVGDE